MKALLSPEESETLVEMILETEFDTHITKDIIKRAANTLQEGLKKIMEDRKKPRDPYQYKISEDKLREIFEKQHQGRALERNHRGNYRSPPIAALWNQHYKTAHAIEKLVRELLNHD